MSVKQMKIQQKIQSIIFETVTSNSNYDLGELLIELTQCIKKEYGAFLTGIYTYSKWQDTCLLYGGTLEKKKLKQKISLREATDVNGEYKQDSYLLTKEDILTSNLIPVESEGITAGYLCIAFKGAESKNITLVDDWKLITADLFSLLNRYKNIAYAKNKAAKYEILYKAIANLHSSMESKIVIQEVIAILKEGYPAFECMFYLIQDIRDAEGLPVKTLSYDGNPDNDISLQALVMEEVQFQANESEKAASVYIPLKGKQGVYGVLQITAPEAVVFPEEEVEFLTSIAYTAGNAMEKAELYQQSRQMIMDLQLINETSHSLNSNLRLSETTHFMKKLLIDTFDAEEVSFVVFKEEKEDFTLLKESTSYFHTKDGKEVVQKLLKNILARKEALFYGEFLEEVEFKNTGYQSMIAVPMVQLNKITGMIVLLHNKKHHFPFQSFELIQSLVHHSTLAFANSLLREELERSVKMDYLSGLYTRKYLDEQIHIDMEKGKMGTFLLLDIDNFKNINDTLGHKVGDEIIIQIAELMKASIQEKDTAARWGGEELAIYLPGVSKEKGNEIAQELLKSVETSTKPKVTASIGVTEWRESQSDDPDKVFQRADEALYKAKGAGKNRVEIML